MHAQEYELLFRDFRPDYQKGDNPFMLMRKRLEQLFVNLEISDMPICNGFGQYVRDELASWAVEVSIELTKKEGNRRFYRVFRKVTCPGKIRVFPLHHYSKITSVFLSELGSIRFRKMSGTACGPVCFIDLFAGIVGIRLGFERAFRRHETVFVSEWDTYAQATYRTNFPTPAEIVGDITKISEKDVPPFDVCLAGFPCQAFSLAGRRMGFQDSYKGGGGCRGTLFQDVVRICEYRKPQVIFCENVKGLTIHDRGRTFKVIKGAFEGLRNWAIPSLTRFSIVVISACRRIGNVSTSYVSAKILMRRGSGFRNRRMVLHPSGVIQTIPATQSQQLRILSCGKTPIPISPEAGSGRRRSLSK